MTYYNIILLWLLLEQFESVLTECPVSCKCYKTELECYKQMPKYIPPLINKVTVYEAYIGEIFNFSDPGWANVTDLSINPGLSAYHSRPESFRTLKGYEFKELKNLERLQIACKCIGKINSTAFYGLDKLRILDLSNNPSLSIDSVAQGLAGKDTVPNLSELYLSNTSVQDFNAFVIRLGFLNAVKTKPLKVLDISNTRNAWFKMYTELLVAFPYLEKLNISNAGLALASLMPPFSSVDLPYVTSFDNLRILDISYPSVPFQITDGVFGEDMPHELNHMHSPLHLTELYARRVISSAGSVVATSNTTHLCFGLRPKREDHKFCYIGSNDSLKKLVLAENLLECIEATVWENFPNLQYLDLSSNKLGKIFMGKRGKAITDILRNLEVLLLADNSISVIKEDTFEGAEHLELLDLSMNDLDKITFKIDSLSSLKLLDLSQNKITVLDELSLARLSNLFDQSQHNQSKSMARPRTKFQKRELVLVGNPVPCSCENIPFLTWLVSLNESYTCLIDRTKHTVDDNVILMAQYLCKEGVVIVVFGSMAFIAVIGAVLIMYVYLKEKRQYMLSKKIKKGRDIYSVSNTDIPPVFLSFCSEDDQTVVSEILPNLEKGLQKVLKTKAQCVATGYSEFRPGFCLANEIIRCIELSSVVVFFVTNAFCKKMWCRNEALTAYYENKPIVLLLWESIDLTVMPKHLYKYYEEYVSVHWILENGERVMKPGWNELSEAIVRLFTEKAKNDKSSSINVSVSESNSTSTCVM